MHFCEPSDLLATQQQRCGRISYDYLCRVAIEVRCFRRERFVRQLQRSRLVPAKGCDHCVRGQWVCRVSVYQEADALSTCQYICGICRYGLLASVLADQQGDFDQFLIFYNHYENSQGLMCWQQVITCTCPQPLSP